MMRIALIGSHIGDKCVRLNLVAMTVAAITPCANVTRAIRPGLGARRISLHVVWNFSGPNPKR